MPGNTACSIRLLKSSTIQTGSWRQPLENTRQERSKWEQPNFPLPPGAAASTLCLPLFNHSNSPSLSAPIKSALKRAPDVNHLHLRINGPTVVHKNRFHSGRVDSASGPPTLETPHTLVRFTPALLCIRRSSEFGLGVEGGAAGGLVIQDTLGRGASAGWERAPLSSRRRLLAALGVKAQVLPGGSRGSASVPPSLTPSPPPHPPALLCKFLEHTRHMFAWRPSPWLFPLHMFFQRPEGSPSRLL